MEKHLAIGRLLDVELGSPLAVFAVDGSPELFDVVFAATIQTARDIKRGRREWSRWDDEGRVVKRGSGAFLGTVAYETTRRDIERLLQRAA